MSHHEFLIQVLLLGSILVEGEPLNPLTQSMIAHICAQSNRIQALKSGFIPHYKIRLLRPVFVIIAKQIILYIELLLVLLGIEEKLCKSLIESIFCCRHHCLLLAAFLSFLSSHFGRAYDRTR